MAARALGELADVRSSPALIDALKTKDKRLKVFIVIALTPFEIASRYSSGSELTGTEPGLVRHQTVL